MNAKNKKLKRASLASLIGGYLLAAMFGVLMVIGVKKPDTVVGDKIDVIDEPVVETNTTIVKQEVVYDSLPRVDYVDRLNGIIIDDPDNVYTAVVNGSARLNTIDVPDVYSRGVDRGIDRGVIVNGVGRIEGDIEHVDNVSRVDVNHRNRGSRVDSTRDDVITFDDATRDDLAVDRNLLDRRLRELEDTKIGLDTKDGLDVGRLSPVTKGSDAELGDVNDFKEDDISSDGGYDVGKGGQLYAYNFPSQGVGAGVGSSSLGAGGGAGAGLSAGIGQGILNGSAVPTLGGVGTYTQPGADGTPGEGSGVGGLTGGAAAGGAAGLYTGQVKPGLGSGAGGPGTGGGVGYSYDHLPEKGSLHIMMHVDGSGSILRTRKQLEIMKDTLLKDALLPYYNNDESLYNRRVTIVDSSGERTLKFFTKAADKDNVLAVVFQDEAQPDYHLPNFNKEPEGHYSDDLRNLKASLNGYQGLYRGVMFQVGDKVFSKSFKEFVENAWRGEGYLESENLSKYYWQENKSNITNKDGIVFSDEYHANATGDPKYYLDIIFNAAKKIGLDLDIQAAGLTDGKKVNN